MTTEDKLNAIEDKLNAIEHDIMMNEELINRDDVITLIARKHLSKEENFHSAITRLNRQVKALKPITIKAELTEILDKISAEIEERIAVYDNWQTQRECTATEANTMREALAIVKKYKAERED